MKACDNRLTRQPQAAFTLIELLASVAILAVMVTLLFSTLNQTQKAWQQGENRVESFQQARAALDFMSKELSQAIVTTNVPFLANTNSLAFIAPVNDSTNGADLVEVVYRLKDAAVPLSKPTQLIRRLTRSDDTSDWDFYANGSDWPHTFDTTLTNAIADNVVSLGFEFVDSAGNTFPFWDSPGINGAWSSEINRGILMVGPTTNMINHAPAGVRILIGVVDSRAVQRFNAIPGASMLTAPGSNIVNQATHYFTTFVSIPNR